MTDDVTPPSRLWQSLGGGTASLLSALAIIVVTTQTRWGARCDARAATSAGAHARWWMRHIDALTVPLMCLLGLFALVGFGIHVRRRNRLLALQSVILIAGTQTCVEVLKHVIHRADGAANTSPSGHTSLAVSLGLAVTLLWSNRVLHIAAGAIAAFVAYGTIIGGWHTPGDVLAAIALTGAWCAVVGMKPNNAGASGLPVMLSVAGGMLVAALGVRAEAHWPLVAVVALLVWGSVILLFRCAACSKPVPGHQTFPFQEANDD